MTRFCITLTACCGLALLGAMTPAGEKPKAFQHDPKETKLFELTNLERKQKELPALVLNPGLSKLARAHSENMARQQKMEHTLDEKSPFDRLRAAGYKFARAGENIAFGEPGAKLENIMKSWMESKEHAANILLPEFTEIGIGIARDKTGALYLTQLFARPRK